MTIAEDKAYLSNLTNEIKKEIKDYVDTLIENHIKKNVIDKLNRHDKSLKDLFDEIFDELHSLRIDLNYEIKILESNIDYLKEEIK